MDRSKDAAEFLRSRRDRIKPEQGQLLGGARRRVPGLRREEVAYLAGVSIDYYVRMERGDLRGVSPEVLDALARALQLDEAETEHLNDLARAAGPQAGRRRKRPVAQTVPVGLQRFIDAVTGAAVWVRDRRMDFIAANPLGRTLYAPVLGDVSRGNTARFVFLDPASRSFFPDWERSADQIVATMRAYAGQNPLDKGLTDIIGELVTRSGAFRIRWAAHDVRFHRSGTKHLRHPEVGDLELGYEAMELPANPEWSMFAYTAEPGTPSAERLALLGSLAATETAAAEHPEQEQEQEQEHDDTR